MLRLLLAMAVTVALGLASRLYPMGWFLWDRVLGEVLYAVAAYLLWAMLLFRRPPWLIGVIAFACCLAVELFKLTGIPAKNQHVFLVRWFLGMTFSAVNLGYYFIGAVLSGFADHATRGSTRDEKRDRKEQGTQHAMTFGGLLVEGGRDAGESLITYFAIPPGREAEAARDLLACLSDGTEVSLRNDLDEGREGVTFFRRTAAGLSSKVGGHGRQGDWEVIDEVNFASAVAALAAHNRGGHWSAQGALIRHKRHTEPGAAPDSAV